jgi:predicted RNA-binding Zn-ribbon protein involved in translation (DUF1610 family)
MFKIRYFNECTLQTEYLEVPADCFRVELPAYRNRKAIELEVNEEDVSVYSPKVSEGRPAISALLDSLQYAGIYAAVTEEEYDDPQDNCPNCGSDNIANEGPPEDGNLQVTCHNCAFQWIEPE